MEIMNELINWANNISMVYIIILSTFVFSVIIYLITNSIMLVFMQLGGLSLAALVCIPLGNVMGVYSKIEFIDYWVLIPITVMSLIITVYLIVSLHTDTSTTTDKER